MDQVFQQNKYNIQIQIISEPRIHLDILVDKFIPFCLLWNSLRQPLLGSSFGCPPELRLKSIDGRLCKIISADEKGNLDQLGFNENSILEVQQQGELIQKKQQFINPYTRQQKIIEFETPNIEKIIEDSANFTTENTITDEEQERFLGLFLNNNEKQQQTLEQQLMKVCYQNANKPTLEEKKTQSKIIYLHTKYLGKKLFQQINKQVVYPLTKDVPKDISVNNIELLFYVLADHFRQARASLYKISQESNIYQFAQLCASDCQDAVVNELEFEFDNTNGMNFDRLKYDKLTKYDFKKELIDNLALAYNVSKEKINIISIEQGSIKVVYQITKLDGQIEEDSERSKEILQKMYPNARIQLKVKPLFQCASLCADDFDEKYNMTWDHFNQGEWDERGPRGNSMKYFFPVGYKGYALKVSNKYDSSNCDWLAQNGNTKEWYILYHGTPSDNIGSIVKNGLRAGQKNVYAKKTCIRTDKIIGIGTSLSNHVEVSELYSVEKYTNIGDKKYYVVFQARVRPEAVRQPKKLGDLRIDPKFTTYFEEETFLPETEKLWDNDYFVVNNSEDIRPYRILLKEIK